MHIMLESPVGQTKLHLNFGFILSLKDQIRRLLLNYWGNVRRLRRLSVQGCISKRAKSKLSSSMLTPVRHVDDLVERARAYRRRAEEETAAGKLLYAEEAYQCAYDYPDGNTQQWIKSFIQSAGVTVGSFCHFTRVRMEIRMEYLGCMMRKSKAKAAKELLTRWEILYGGPTSEKIKVQYLLGLMLVSVKREVDAAFRFEEIFGAQPGHEGAKLDVMEARLRSVEAYRQEAIKEYLDEEYESVRHQKLDRLPTEGKESDELMPGLTGL